MGRSTIPQPRLLCFLVLFSVVLWSGVAGAAAVPVRFPEGMVRGFLLLSDSRGARLGAGDFLQERVGGDVRSRTLLVFRDGSVHDETAVFSQQRDFTLQSYRLVQKGPSFRDDMDARLERSGEYVVKVRSRKSGQEKVLKGRIDLPPDVYNGMVPIIIKNIAKGEKIHMVAFTPAPTVIALDIVPSGEERVLVGDLKKSALHYVLKPKLGVMLKIPAALMGRTPPDNHMWVITADVPAFVKFEGPLYVDGPIWRIELTSPVWPK